MSKTQKNYVKKNTANTTARKSPKAATVRVTLDRPKHSGAAEYLEALMLKDVKIPGDGDPSRTIRLKLMTTLPPSPSPYGHLFFRTSLRDTVSYSTPTATALGEFEHHFHPHIVDASTVTLSTRLNLVGGTHIEPSPFRTPGFSHTTDSQQLVFGSYWPGSFSAMRVRIVSTSSAETMSRVRVAMQGCGADGPRGASIDWQMASALDFTASYFSQLSLGEGFYIGFKTTDARAVNLDAKVHFEFTHAAGSSSTSLDILSFASESDRAAIAASSSARIVGGSVLLTNSTTLDDRGGTLNLANFPPGTKNVPTDSSELFEYIGALTSSQMSLTNLRLGTGGFSGLLCHGEREQEFFPWEELDYTGVRFGAMAWAQPAQDSDHRAQTFTLSAELIIVIKTSNGADIELFDPMLNQQFDAYTKAWSTGVLSHNPDHFTAVKAYARRVANSPELRAFAKHIAMTGATTLLSLL